jgi:hypothetical protein
MTSCFASPPRPYHLTHPDPTTSPTPPIPPRPPRPYHLTHPAPTTSPTPPLPPRPPRPYHLTHLAHFMAPSFLPGRRELLWSARKCTVLLLASLQPPPPPEKFILLLRGILEYRASQHTGVILADEKPVIIHCFLEAEISAAC